MVCSIPWLDVYLSSINQKCGPGLGIYHVVRMNEEEKDFCKNKFNAVKMHIYGKENNF